MSEVSPLSEQSATSDEQGQATPAEGELFEPSPQRGRVPAMPGVSVHFSRLTGRYTAIVDLDTTAAQMTTALARYLPADVRLVETLSHVGATLIVFQGEPDPPGGGI
ncbi:hypothetical protein FF36_05329 [Frankia torreyi]|uniref:Uncharacterized protein n=1 Tax=Frankia torreyi TaxID=1856 RepID=A0A0D8B8E0_9ACTN|nr:MULTISPECIES: hypothetical protein [Frankia]KJE20355.1 hypothetical protein FF36_05329 [Frankia torreyi]KQM02741.1 hypothetical protein FF86_105733 [Frankia sp. CpI1-P]